MRYRYSINTVLVVALAGGCSTSNDEVFNDIPREVEQEYADELRELGLDVSLERMELVAPFRSIASLDAITASSLSRLPAPALHVDRYADPPRIDAMPAGWWPLDVEKLQEPGAPEVELAVVDVAASIQGQPVTYTAFLLRSQNGPVRIVDPVLDPDPPAVATVESFAATAPGVIEDIDDGDGCPNRKYKKALENVIRYDQDSWGLDNRMLMEWKYRFDHQVTIDCRKDGPHCVAFEKTYSLDRDVLNSRKCSPWWSSTTSCEGISDWSTGNSTFSSGNWANTYYSTTQIEGDHKLDDIEFGPTNNKRLGYHFRGIAQARVITTYDFSVAPALPAWVLQLYYGAAIGYYSSHLIKFVHWLIKDEKAAQNPWFEAALSGRFDSEVELTCGQPAGAPAPGGGVVGPPRP